MRLQEIKNKMNELIHSAYVLGYEDGLDGKALEQQPCEDVVSRQAVLDGLASIAKAKARSDAQKSLMGRVMFFTEHLPSVAPQPKPGRWIEHFDESGKWYECDQCHTDWGGPVNYCPNCGCAMGVDKR